MAGLNRKTMRCGVHNYELKHTEERSQTLQQPRTEPWPRRRGSATDIGTHLRQNSAPRDCLSNHQFAWESYAQCESFSRTTVQSAWANTPKSPYLTEWSRNQSSVAIIQVPHHWLHDETLEGNLEFEQDRSNSTTKKNQWNHTKTKIRENVQIWTNEENKPRS